ncbi:MAG: pyrroline-5-carboxylate reductase [Oscillospiraceae bacterium]
MVGFIGAGNIATAIIGGSVKSGYIKSDNIYIYDVDFEKSEKLSIYSSHICRTIEELIKKCNFIFLTVKPQIYPVEIKPLLSSEKCLIDVAAGITINYVKSAFDFDCKVIRVMPNTPILYSNGATAMVNVSPVTDDEFFFIKGIFDSCGITVVVSESLINTVTSVSGSSPAFVFRFANNMIKAGIDNGLTESDAKSLVIQTLIGSANMMLKSELSTEELIRMVTSPGGTTKAGLDSMDATDFDSSVTKAVESAIKRAEELQK